MFNYKSKTGVVNYKRFAINNITGVTLANQHPELDKLVDSGDLVLETSEVLESAVATPVDKVVPTPSVKNETPVKPTA